MEEEPRVPLRALASEGTPAARSTARDEAYQGPQLTGSAPQFWLSRRFRDAALEHQFAEAKFKLGRPRITARMPTAARARLAS